LAKLGGPRVDIEVDIMGAVGSLRNLRRQKATEDDDTGIYSVRKVASYKLIMQMFVVGAEP
jgi:hypothetical protein